MITVESVMINCGCRSDGECTHNRFAELAALDLLVDTFAVEMKRKLRIKALEGFTGWDDRASRVFILSSLVDRAQVGKAVDAANFAAMLWNMRDV